MTFTDPLRRSIRYALLSGVAMALTVPTAIAQQNNDDEEEEVARELDRVQVTGSRITREGIDTHYPALSITSQELEDRGFTNVADALNELPSFGTPPVTPDGTQGGFTLGQNYVDFLGLGAQRTLTLVNGRRFVSQNTPSIFSTSGGLQVDFNVIPVAMVDRIEVIGIGGAPVYGSDAIAGTINVILKDDYEGMDFSMQTGWTEEGGGEYDQFSYVTGANMMDGRGNVTMSVEWFKQEGMSRFERGNLYDPENSWGWGTFGDQTRRLYNNERTNVFTNAGLVSPDFQVIPTFGLGSVDGTFYQFDDESNLVEFTPGDPAPDNRGALWALGGDGDAFFQQTDQIRSPLERKVVTTSMNFHLTDDVRFSSDFLFAESEAEELSSQGGFQTFAFTGTSGPLLFPTDHPFLSDQAQQVFADADMDQFWLHRFNNDVIDPSSQRDQSVWRWTAGFDGDLYAGNRQFHWDISTVAGRSSGETRDEGIIDGRFLNALEVRVLTEDDVEQAGGEQALLAFSGTESAGAGDMVCEAVYQAALGNETGVSGSGVTAENMPFVDGCIPLNIFGDGVMDPDARNWVTGDRMTQTRINQTIFTANFGGDMFEMPGGMSAFNLGYETRKEDARFIPGLGTEVPLTRSAPFLETGGSYKTDEYYGEVFFPILSPANEVPFAHRLEANASLREIENDLAGDATVWSLGGVWSPVRDVTFRGNYTESIRAPSLVELFAPQTQVFSFADDPCDQDFVNSGPDPDQRRANCEQSVDDPDAFTSDITLATGIGSSGGNPNLLNESAESYALGITFEPRWVENLVLTADYYNIEIEDAITSLSLTDLMQACYDSPDFPNVSACDAFVRDDEGQVADFTTGQTNAQEFRLSQVNVGAQYRFNIAEAFGADGDLGNLGFNTRFTQTRDRTTSVAGDAAPQQVGGFNQPKNRAIFDTTWTRGDWRVFWRTDWTRRPRLDPAQDLTFVDDDDNPVYRSRSRHIHNASVSYNFSRGFDWAPQDTILQLGVNNVFDRSPNRVERASGHFGMAEILGRNYQLTLRGSY